MELNIIVNDFVKRQTLESRFSHYVGTWEELRQQVETNFRRQKQGYRPGVVLIPVPSKGFFSGIAQLQEGSKLVGGFEPRKTGEAPRKFVTSVGAYKLPAKNVDVVLYSSEVLAEDGDNQLPAISGNWEIISVNASPTEASPPIDPIVLMHNHFGSEGGTTTNLSNEGFVKTLRASFEFWKDKSMCG